MINMTEYPKKYMAAGVVFYNREGKVLILHPAYKDRWEIPGGIVEANESPKAGAEREVREEFGLERSVGRLLCIDYSINLEGVENLQFVFDGGVLSDEDIAHFKLQSSEVASYEFVPVTSEADRAFILERDRLGPRLLQAIDAKENEQTVYLEKGQRKI
jgi:8-oxo-dGTP pyrophosphatase MutT (NUDIX family)